MQWVLWWFCLFMMHKFSTANLQHFSIIWLINCGFQEDTIKGFHCIWTNLLSENSFDIHGTHVDTAIANNSEQSNSVNVVLGFREKFHKLDFKSDLIFISNYMLLWLLNKLPSPSTEKVVKQTATNLFQPIQPVSDILWNISHVAMVQNCYVKR